MRIKIGLIMALSSILMACAHTPAPPAVEVRTVEVKVPVATPCVDKREVPDEPAKVGGALNGNAAHDLDIVAASALTLRNWGRQLNVLIAPCVRP